MTPAAAILHHQGLILAEEDGVTKLADSHLNPLDQTVYYWHKQWRLLNYGNPSNTLETLREKIPLYKEKGVTVKITEDGEGKWAVLITTPIMKRAQNLFHAKKIAFVDTSASCDASSTNVTIMLTGTKAGAVPLSVFCHESQTGESYKTAFEMYKSEYPPGFGGADHPDVFMSDNSQAEKNALREVWPESEQLLCGFHVGQAEWGWLQSNASKEARSILMKAFQKIQYAKSTEELEEAIDALRTLSPEYYDMRVSGLLNNLKEWVQLFRAEMDIDGNHTNNYAEATIRVLKDVILQRIKAFNLVALVDYIAVAWEKYLQIRLSKIAYKRVSKPLLLYNDLLLRLPQELGDKIVVVDEDTYIVPSAKTGEATYEVTASTGTCLCKAASAGAFCKHMALVHQRFGKVFPNQPLIKSADRYLLGQLAMGTSCPEKSFFLDPTETLEETENDLEQFTQVYSKPKQSSYDETSLQEEPTVNTVRTCDEVEEPNSEDVDTLLEKFIIEWKRLFTLGTETNPSGFLKFMKRAVKGMEKVSNSNKAFEAMMKTSHVLKQNVGRSGKKIKVQPPALQRRRQGLTKGNARVPSGRPSGVNNQKNKKRPRKLGVSVAQNKAHYKKH